MTSAQRLRAAGSSRFGRGERDARAERPVLERLEEESEARLASLPSCEGAEDLPLHILPVDADRAEPSSCR